MTLNDTTKLACAELAIYIVLLQPTLYLFYLHGLHAFRPFIYLIAIQVLRIVAAGIQISNRNASTPSEAAAIVSSVGLSPLLLSWAAFVNLFWGYYRSSTASRRDKFLELASEVVIHAGAIAGIALVAVGASDVAGQNSTASDIKTGRTMLEVGAVLLLLVWLTVLLYCFHILFRSVNTHTPFLVRALMVSAGLFIGIRSVYSMVFAFDHKASLSPFTGTFAVKLVLTFLVLLFATMSLIGVAIVSRHSAVRKDAPRRRRDNLENRDGNVPLTTRSAK